MNDNDNQMPHCMWHHSSEFLRQADAMSNHNLLKPALIQRARRLHRKRMGGFPSPMTSGVRSLGQEFFGLNECVEVVRLGYYTDWAAMVRDLREHYQADIVNKIECNGQEIVAVRRNSGRNLTEGLKHVVTVAVCNGRALALYPMLIVAVHGR